MKATFALALIAAFANSGMASPMEGKNLNVREQAGFFDVFGLPGKIFNSAFDGASCIVSSFIGGRGPLCGGRAVLSTGGNLLTGGANGDISVSANVNANRDSFTFEYTTESDGRIKITIKPDAKGKNNCITTVEAKGKIDDLVAKAARECI